MQPGFSPMEKTFKDYNTKDLRLACQVKVFGDIEIEKFDGVFGQKVGVHSTTLNEGSNLLAGFNLEYIMDKDS